VLDERANAAARAHLEALVADGAQVSVQVAAYVHGELVVDAWAGAADRAPARPAAGDAGWPRRARP
jgi:hypothetical protein